MKQKLIYKYLIIIICACAWSGQAWAQTQTYTTQYVLNENTDEVTIMNWRSKSSPKEYNFSGPGHKLTFQYKKLSGISIPTGKYYVKAYKSDGTGETSLISFNASNSTTSWQTYPSDGSYDLSQKTGYLYFRKLIFSADGTESKLIRSVKLTRATTLSFSETDFTDTSRTLSDFGSVAIGSSSSPKTVTFYYNNTLTNRTLEVTSSSPDFVVTYDGTLSLGAYGNKSINVTFQPTSVGSKSGTITLTLAKLTANGITVDEKKITISVSGTGTQTYSFAANAIPNNNAYGSASYELSRTSVTSSNTSETAIATFTATANTGYEFVCWGSSANATSDNTANPYSVTLTATETTPSQSKTLYAIFKPVFNFTATAVSSNTELGTATASFGDEAAQTVSKKVLGDVGTNSLVQMATFTATPADADCVFLGWFDSNTYSGTPVSTDLTYSNVPLTSGINTTGTKTLYALFKKTHNLHWVDDDMDLNLVLGTTGHSSAASVTSGKTITYRSSNTDALTIGSDGTLTIEGLGKSTVTASVEGDNIYIEQTLTREFNVGEKKQANFTPAWGDGRSTDIKVGDNTTIALTNIATDGTFSMVVTPPTGVISCSREGNTLTIHGDVAGTATLSLAQTGNTYLYGKTAEYEITVSRYANTFTLAAGTKTMEIGEKWTNVVTNTGNGNTQVSYSVDGIATYNATYNRIEAMAEGSTTITFTQAATADHDGTTQTINVTVTKVANSLAITLPSQDVEVDGTINLTVDNKNNPSDITAEITEEVFSSDVYEGIHVITFANNVITACNAGTAKIKFKQAATTTIAGFESDVYDITVSKIGNAITVKLDDELKNSKNMGRNSSIDVECISVSNGDVHFSLASGSAGVTNYDIDNGKITSGNVDGTDNWTITQDETYKYEAATTSIRIKVNSVEEAKGYVYTGWTGNDEEYSWSTIGETNALELTGPGDVFSFYAKATDILWVWNSKEFYAEYSTNNGDTWEKAVITGTNSTNINIPEKDKWYPFSCNIPENATHVRLKTYTDATGYKHVRDIRVTRKTFVRLNDYQGTDLGETYVDATPYRTKKFTVSYSTINGGPIEIISYNPRFEVNPSSIEVSDNSDNVGDNATPVEVTVTYKPDKLGYEFAGADNATITASDLFNSAELMFMATSKKRDITIARGENKETTTVDGEIDQVFSITGTSATLSDDNTTDLYYVINHSPSTINNGNGVISYNPATNTIKGLNGGTATLTIYQKSTSVYNATSQSFTFTVNKLTNNTKIALSTLTFDVDGTSTVELTNNDSKGALSASYSNNTYTNLSQNRDGELLSFNSSTNTLTGWNAGTGTVTITQAETYKYVSKSATFNVRVNKVAQNLTWENPYLETTMQINSTLTGNAATSDADPRTFEDGIIEITYSSDNTEAITVDANTGDLTAVDEGSNISITATQAGNYKYLPATLTRQFSVFNKQTPAFVADAHFTGASGRVEYTCTATIRVTGVGADSEEGFTITNGDNAVINVERDGETITITGLAIGSTTLTLAQAGNEDYIAKSQTYDIEVYMPEDFLTLEPTSAPSHEEGQYRKIFLHRTLKEGLSTIALPFNTTVAALTDRSDANDWVAQLETVTHTQADSCTKDEYTLYFKKVEGGVITANQPYVLHLGAAVVNPTWTDMADGISVSAASANEQSATKGYTGYAGWAMTANYEVGMDMEGKYGVVNGKGLQLGASGSKLNAYTAYITAPSDSHAPLLRLACVDEDGTVTLIGGPSADGAAEAPVAIYGPDGKRRSRLQPGVNIVRQADGTVRKVQR